MSERKISPLFGIMLMVAGVSLGAVNGALLKALTPLLSETMISFVRYAAYLAIVLPFAIFHHGTALLRPPQPLLQLARGALLCVATWSFIYAAAGMPIADAIALIYVYPFMVTAIAPAALGERVPAAAWYGVIGGFAGVVIVMRPDIGGVDVHALSAVLCGAALAFSLLINRKLASSSPPLVTSTTSAVIGTTVFALPLLGGWQPIGLEAAAMIGVLGLISAANQWMILEAFAHAKASTLAPFGYAEIVAGVIVGFLWFGDVPDRLVWIGMAVIVASGLIVARARQSG